MSGEDFIFPNTVQLLCQICLNRAVSIVCCVQYLEENLAGNMVIDGIEGKKFFQHVDEQFKNVNAPIFFDDNNIYQRLIMTGSRVFNPLIGTKFFCRKFLEKKSLRFSEDSPNSFELLFVASAVMHSAEIAFTPQIFYIAPRK